MRWDDLQSTGGYRGLEAYARAKLLNLMWTYELARRLRGTGITVVADSAQFSTAVSELAPPGTAGSALALQTAGGFLLTGVTIVGIGLLDPADRSAGAAIAAQMFDERNTNGISVLLGGGSRHFMPAAAGGTRQDERFVEAAPFGGLGGEHEPGAGERAAHDRSSGRGWRGRRAASPPHRSRPPEPCGRASRGQYRRSRSPRRR